MTVMNRGHYQYNASSEHGEFVCNGHFPEDSAEIVCLDEKSATWLRNNATISGVRWRHPRMLVVGSTEDALTIVGKAVGDGLRVTTNHIPAVSDTESDSRGRSKVKESAKAKGRQLAYGDDPEFDKLIEATHTLVKRVATTEVRTQISRDPNRPITKGTQEYLDFRKKIMDEVKKDWPWLDFGENWVPHDYQFDSPHFFEFLKKRKYATYHDAEMDGYVPRTKDIGRLDAEFVCRIGVLKSDREMIGGLRRGRTNEGEPLVMEDPSSGYKPIGLREPKPVLPDALEKLRADGSLWQHLDRGTIFEAQSGVYVELVEVYAHPDIAAHLKKVIADTYSTIMAEWARDTGKPSALRRALNFISSRGARRKTGP